jgi:hypothetical protein
MATTTARAHIQFVRIIRRKEADALIASLKTHP